MLKNGSEKIKLFLDYDMTIVNSIKTICDMYNEEYSNHVGFTPANHDLVQKWDFKDQCPLLNNCERYFSSKEFFDRVEFIEDNTKEVIQKHAEKFYIIICSIGTPSNIAYKSLWLEKNLPFIKDYVMLRNKGTKMNKSIVNMSDSVFVDDVSSNLLSSNADVKILFGKEYEWNKVDIFLRIYNWTQLDKLLSGKR